jgi:hypothetical protein
MPSKSKANKGSVGIVSGGVLKVSTVYVFKHDETEQEEFAQTLSQYYGNEFEMKYVLVEDVEDVYEKFLEALDKESRVGETSVFRVSVSDASKILKEESGAKACKTFSLKRKSKGDKDESGDEEDEKPKKKSSSKKAKDESDGEAEEEDEKPKKKSSSKKAKNESEDEAEEEDEKPKKKSSSKKAKDESEDEAESGDEEDSKDKKLKKKGDKSEKGKGKSKSK